jgi:predicted Zn-dependent protease
MGDDVPVHSLVRWAMVMGAAVVAAWFGLGWVQARDLGRATALISAGKLSAGRAGTAASLLNTAGRLNPDRSVDIARAQLLDDRHELAPALRIMKEVTAAEPLNLEAWRELGVVATHDHQRHLAQTAFTHVLRLVGYRH